MDMPRFSPGDVVYMPEFNIPCIIIGIIPAEHSNYHQHYYLWLAEPGRLRRNNTAVVDALYEIYSW